MLKEKYPGQEFNCNWLYRDLLQHDYEIRTLGIDYGKTKSNGVRSIFICYNADRDSSGGKILYTENAVPADPVEQMRGDTLIAMAAEMMRRNLAKQGITVPAFNPDL